MSLLTPALPGWRALYVWPDGTRCELPVTTWVYDDGDDPDAPPPWGIVESDGKTHPADGSSQFRGYLPPPGQVVSLADYRDSRGGERR